MLLPRADLYLIGSSRLNCLARVTGSLRFRSGGGCTIPVRLWFRLLVLAAVGMPLAPVLAANITVVAGLDAVRPLINIALAASSMRPDARDQAAVALGGRLPCDF